MIIKIIVAKNTHDTKLQLNVYLPGKHVEFKPMQNFVRCPK